MRTHSFTAVFPAINYWFVVAVVETGDEFSIIYNFVTIFVNTVYSKFKIFLILFFIVKIWKLKVQSCKLYENKYMITSKQITNIEIFAFIAVLVFKLLSRKVLFINRKDNRNC